MNMNELAIFGGSKIREKPFPHYPIITDAEKNNVLDVLNSQNLSAFAASAGENFLGGKKIREFEKKFAKYLDTKFAIAFNSATSALHAANVAVGVRPGEEVIVPPYTFTSTATSVLMNNGIPVFSDIDSMIYCLDPKKLEEHITEKTRAVIAVHLFGQPCDILSIIEIAKKYDIKVIEDCAQSPGAQINGVKNGTFGDCGIFSFQESKNMMTGEGGMLVTNNEEIAKIAQMVRNHGEVILEHEKNRKYRAEILGWGYRMTELEAAIGITQLEKLDKMNDVRIELSEYLIKNLTKIEGIKHNFIENTKNVYYVTAFSYDEEKIGIPRNEFCEALNAEGIPFRAGYLNLLYFNPLYQKRMAHAFDIYDGNVSYDKGICPTAENVQEKQLIMTLVCRPPATKSDMDDIINAFHKIINNKHEFEKRN